MRRRISNDCEWHLCRYCLCFSSLTLCAYRHSYDKTAMFSWGKLKYLITQGKGEEIIIVNCNCLNSLVRTWRSPTNKKISLESLELSLSDLALCVFLSECFFLFFSPLSDVNECEFANSSDSLHRNDPCLHRCDNLPGSYRCYCKDGYHLKGDRCEGLKNLNLYCCVTQQSHTWSDNN